MRFELMTPLSVYVFKTYALNRSANYLTMNKLSPKSLLSDEQEFEEYKELKPRLSLILNFLEYKRFWTLERTLKDVNFE